MGEEKTALREERDRAGIAKAPYAESLPIFIPFSGHLFAFITLSPFMSDAN